METSFLFTFDFFSPPWVEGEVNDTNPPDAQVDFQTPLSEIISVLLFYSSVFALWAAVGREEIFYARYSLCVRFFRKPNGPHLNSLWNNTAEDLHLMCSTSNLMFVFHLKLLIFQNNQCVSISPSAAPTSFGVHMAFMWCYPRMTSARKLKFSGKCRCWRYVCLQHINSKIAS